MIDFIFYTIKTIGIQMLFLSFYYILLKKETFFTLNRFYLLGSFFLSLIIPVLTINVSQKFETPFLQLQEIIISTNDKNEFTIQSFSVEKTLKILYSAGAFLACLLLTIKLQKIYKHLKNSTVEYHNQTKVYRIKNSNQAFSFLNYIFVGQNNPDVEIVLQHELFHKRNLHSADLILLEICKIVFWFNPLVHVFQKLLTETHEFETDSKIVKTNKSDYYKSIINQVFEIENFAFTNNFFNQSLIKKRIVMLQKSKSKRIELVKYLFIIPIITTSILLFSNCTSEDKRETPNQVTKETGTETFSFTTVDKIPQFEGCEAATNEEALACFNEKMMQHIKENFTYPEEAAEKNITGRIAVQFVIDIDGSIVNIETKGPENSSQLQAEAKRIVESLPKFKPAILNGKPVKIKYGLPITFKLQ
ncbi:MAG: TonB family protein [Flavobacteriaceae bacterium]|nr:TonB family protein [Flavobacteriaceae bacterium]